LWEIKKSKTENKMIVEIAALVVAAGLGFGVGRIKSAAKLAAIKAELEKVEASTIADVKALAAKIKSLL
jgi:hypothetical protein